MHVHVRMFKRYTQVCLLAQVAETRQALSSQVVMSEAYQNDIVPCLSQWLELDRDLQRQYLTQLVPEETWPQGSEDKGKVGLEHELRCNDQCDAEFGMATEQSEEALLFRWREEEI